MLELAEKEGFEKIVSWLQDEKSFKVYDPSAFVKEIMPNFFQQSKYKSFQRQCKYFMRFRKTILLVSACFSMSHTHILFDQILQ